MSNHLEDFCYVQNNTIAVLSSLAILWLFEHLFAHWELEWPEISWRTTSFFPWSQRPWNCTGCCTALITILKTSGDTKNPEMMPIVYVAHILSFVTEYSVRRPTSEKKKKTLDYFLCHWYLHKSYFYWCFYFSSGFWVPSVFGLYLQLYLQQFVRWDSVWEL